MTRRECGVANAVGLILASKALKYKKIVAILAVGGRLRWANLM
jgi:phosphate/sulfate permease